MHTLSGQRSKHWCSRGQSSVSMQVTILASLCLTQ
ncbi:unnamed protein product [Arabidopsis halleri]